MRQEWISRTAGYLSVRHGFFSRGEWLSLILVPLLLYAFHLDGARTLTDHEAYVAGSAKQMTTDHDWIVLRIGDQSWLEKPPLTHWIAALSAKLLGGFTAGNVRLPFALAGVGVILLVACTMATLFGPRIGFLSGLVQSGMVYMVRHARLAQADMLLLLLFMAAVGAYIMLVHRADQLSTRARLIWRLVFWGLLGLTNLAKGMLFGSVLVLVTCVGGTLVCRRASDLRQLWSPAGMLLAVMIASWWPLTVVSAEPTVVELWSAHLFGRAVDGIGYGKPIWYYLTTWPEQLLPWTPILFWSVGASLRKAWQQPCSERFIWWWALSQLFLLSFSAGKHHHYLIYALPAMSPLVAMGLLRIEHLTMISPEANQRSVRRMVRLGGAALAGGIIASVFLERFRLDILWMTAVLTAGSVCCARLFHLRMPRSGFAVAVAALLVAHLYVQGIIMPRRDPSAQDVRFLSAVEDRLGLEQRLFACGGPEIARHLFYLSRPVQGVSSHRHIGRHLRGENAFYVITRGRHADELAEYGRVDLVLQSAHTRRESSPADRYSLFRVTTRAEAAGIASQPGRGAGSSDATSTR